MFSGRWEESGKEVIPVDIPDPNVTEEGRSNIHVLLTCFFFPIYFYL